MQNPEKQQQKEQQKEQQKSNIDLLNDCSFSPIDSVKDQLTSFDCNDDDLNDFFKSDSHNYTEQLLGKTYCFVLESSNEIVCAFTLANDSIKASLLPNSRKKKVQKQIPHQKTMKSYPAVMIGRLGVDAKFQGCGIGKQLMNFIKGWFIDNENKTGCRFIVVDAYVNEKATAYYQRNGFINLFSTLEQEREYLGLPKDKELDTRLMIFDLIVLRSET